MSELRYVPLCAACREGAGGECHTPGCALWMNRAPDVPIQYDADALPVLPSEMLADFHSALSDEPGREDADLRITLHREEHAELIEALEICGECAEHEDWGGPQACGDCRRALARELADVAYITYGTAHAFDIDLDAALTEIHRAAMSKLFPPNGMPRVVREDGKIMKPVGFVPPDMSEAVQ